MAVAALSQAQGVAASPSLSSGSASTSSTTNVSAAASPASDSAASTVQSPADTASTARAAAPTVSRPPPPPSLATLQVAPGLGIHKLDDNDITSYMVSNEMHDNSGNVVTLTGDAEVRRSDTILKGDTLVYNKQTGVVTADGHVRILRDASLITGTHANYDTRTKVGDIDSAEFWIGASGGHATAEHAHMLSESKVELTTVNYTGCDCTKPSWYIKATSADLDFADNRGVAHDGVLYFKDVPILASPYLTFPVKKERRTGFLMPTYGTTSNSGFEVTVPYYINLDPQYDLTLYPRVMSKRGSQLGADFRYLTPTASGFFDGTYLPHDLETNTDRWTFWWHHQQQLGDGFYTDWDYAKASDNNYFRDFSTIGLTGAATTYLPQRAEVGWANPYWQSSVQVYKYQTLEEDDSFVLPPYNKMPELTLNGQDYNLNGFDVEMTSSAVRFQRDELDGTRYGPNGERLEVYPTVAYPVRGNGWYFTPKVGVNYTHYQSTNWYTSQGYNFNGLTDTSDYQDSASRTVPIASVDTGMTFERASSLFGQPTTQTLEPRLYYLRIPYRNQSDLPVYDTSLADFNFDQIYSENPYSGGWDRIQNANQVTMGLTSRWLDSDSGFERLKLQVAQQTYFQDQDVTLPGETPRVGRHSDWLFGADAALTNTVSTGVLTQYDPYNHSWSKAQLTARWHPERLATVAVAYRYQREPDLDTLYAPEGQDQISLSAQWPLTKRWSVVGRVDYAFHNEATAAETEVTDGVSKSGVTQAFLGVEYKGDCCWVGRVVYAQYAVSSSETNTALFFQLELTGLGSLGTDPMQALQRYIPGYQNVETPPSPATTYERYE